MFSYGGLFGNYQNGSPLLVFLSSGYLNSNVLMSLTKYFSNLFLAYDIQSSKFLGLNRSNYKAYTIVLHSSGVMGLNSLSSNIF